MRVVLFSDTSKDFPDKTSGDFKVRLPKPLQLEDGPWELGLSSVSPPDAGFDRTSNLIEAALFLNGYVLKWATVSMAGLDQSTITDRVEFMKVIADQIQWIQTWNAQLSGKRFSDGDGPGFCWEGDDLILIRRSPDIITLPSAYKPKIRRAFAISMGWWVYNNATNWWQLDPNLQYGIGDEWVSSGKKGTGDKSIRRNLSNDIAEDSHWVYLNVFSD